MMAIRMTLVILALLSVQQAQAIPLSFTFDAIIDEIWFPGAVMIGDRVIGTVIYDTDEMSSISSLHSARYDFSGGNAAIKLEVGGLPSESSDFSIFIGNNVPAIGVVQAPCAGNNFDSFLLDGAGIRLGIFNCDASAFDSTALPTSVPFVGSGFGQFRLDDVNPEYSNVTPANDPGQYFFTSLRISPVRVSEPASVAIVFTLAVLMLCGPVHVPRNANIT